MDGYFEKKSKFINEKTREWSRRLKIAESDELKLRLKKFVEHGTAVCKLLPLIDEGYKALVMIHDDNERIRKEMFSNTRRLSASIEKKTANNIELTVEEAEHMTQAEMSASIDTSDPSFEAEVEKKAKEMVEMFLTNPEELFRQMDKAKNNAKKLSKENEKWVKQSEKDIKKAQEFIRNIYLTTYVLTIRVLKIAFDDKDPIEWQKANQLAWDELKGAFGFGALPLIRDLLDIFDREKQLDEKYKAYDDIGKKLEFQEHKLEKAVELAYGVAVAYAELLQQGYNENIELRTKGLYQYE